jgi:aryl-alcohol dehydrogenase-like predicted oxidoreductase
MKHRTFPKLSREVSEVGLGCWQIGAEWGPVSDETATRVLHAAWDAGIDFFDTADVYGHGRSERRIGRFLRETSARPFLATKLGRFSEPGWPHNFRPAVIRRHVENSLRRLGVDCVDLVQLHCVPLDVLERGEVFDVLRDLRADGLIRAFGASVETFREAEICLRDPDCASLQVIFNLFRQEPRDRLFDRCVEQGVAILARLPLSSGLLGGKMTAATRFTADDHRNYNRDGAAFHIGETFTGLPFERGLALVDEVRDFVPSGTELPVFAQRFILDHPAVTTIIPGATRPTQVASNASASEAAPLSKALHHRLAAFERERVRPHVRGHG